MIRKYTWSPERKEFVETVRSISRHHFVQGDIKEYGGRRQWREHLKRNGSIEVGADDMKKATEKWNSRKADHAEKMKRAEKMDVRPSNVNVMESRPYEMSLLNRELANRLDGRPAPERKMLIKMTLDLQRSLGRRS